MKQLAIAIPTYNEKDNIIDLIEEIKKVTSNINISTTIIIIDDNSPDGTGKIADDLAQKYNNGKFRLYIIHRKGKLGLASAYIEAFKWALGENEDYVLSMDADFSHQPKYIPDFLDKIESYDLVIGSRNIPEGRVENWSILRKLISRCGSFYARTILNINIKDFTGGYNMFTNKALESINLNKIKSEGYSFQIEMKYRCVKKGLKYIEIPIVFPNRRRGKAKMSKKILFEAMLKVWQIKFSK